MSAKRILQIIHQYRLTRAQRIWTLPILLVTSLVMAACAGAQSETISVGGIDGVETEVGAAGEAGSAEAISANTYQTELLRAGEVDDNVRWDEYLRFEHGAGRWWWPLPGVAQ